MKKYFALDSCSDCISYSFARSSQCLFPTEIVIIRKCKRCDRDILDTEFPFPTWCPLKSAKEIAIEVGLDKQINEIERLSGSCIGDRDSL